MKIKVKNLRSLLTWMEERQKIYLKRIEDQKPPWTEDPVMRRYRFCNVYRNQDRETRWLHKNWIEPQKRHENLWFAVSLFRQINWSPTLEEIGFPKTWNAQRVLSTMLKRASRDEKVYTSAYMISSHGETSKAVYTVNRVLDPLWKSVRSKKAVPVWADGRRKKDLTLEAATEWFSQFHGFGNFLAYEVVTDLRWTRYLENATDIYTWSNPGPGARRGICRLLELDFKTARLSRQDLIDCMKEIYCWIRANKNQDILPTLEMRDIEHCCCEYDKYRRAQERLRAGRAVGLERFRGQSRLI